MHAWQGWTSNFRSRELRGAWLELYQGESLSIHHLGCVLLTNPGVVWEGITCNCEYLGARNFGCHFREWLPHCGSHHYYSLLLICCGNTHVLSGTFRKERETWVLSLQDRFLKLWEFCLPITLYTQDSYDTQQKSSGYFKKEREVGQSCPTLCDPVHCGLPGFSIHAIFQERVLEWVAISFSRGSSWPRDRTQVSHIADRCFTIWTTREASYFKEGLFQGC